MARLYTQNVGISRNGMQVYTGIINTKASRCFSRQPYLMSIVKDVLRMIDLEGVAVTLSQDIGRSIGNTHIVATKDKDTIFYARPPKKTNSLRFVKNRSMESSQELSLVFEQDSDGDYELTNLWIGPLYPPFPDEDNANEESVSYWKTHAFTAGSELIDLQTVTSICPYEVE